mgnify:CR=1 FL=1
MRYIPHTDEDIAAMLQVVGVDTLESLFSHIPQDCRRSKDLDLPVALTEWELNDHMDALANQMADAREYKVFVGAGSYNHYIPEVARQLLSRSEFYTAYTPYQPEVSQGTLQAIYEYQTLTSRLLGMEVANASMYDGASALAEALLMAIRITRRSTVAISGLIHPLYRRVVQTYLNPTGYNVVTLPYDREGRTDISTLEGRSDLAAVAVQSPNFFGCIEDLAMIGQAAHADAKTLLVTAFTEPLAYGLLKSPGVCGADISCGEGQSLGLPQSFGGPGLGMFAARKKYMRNMPGRLVGQTVDKDGQRGFVLTLSTREQHIRREKATSNICSNQGLCATATAMYMATVGGTGLRALARLNYDKAAYLKQALQQAGLTIPFAAPTFNEFVVQFPQGFESAHRGLRDRKIIAGLSLAPYYPELTDHYLLCVTETMDRKDMDSLVREVQS